MILEWPVHSRGRFDTNKTNRLPLRDLFIGRNFYLCYESSPRFAEIGELCLFLRPLISFCIEYESLFFSTFSVAHSNRVMSCFSFLVLSLFILCILSKHICVNEKKQSLHISLC